MLLHRYLLVRLDGIQGGHSLDCTNFIRPTHWFRSLEHLPAGAQLPGRCVLDGKCSLSSSRPELLTNNHRQFAASAIAANTFLRSLCGAAFPLFARQMFQGMGIQWASTLLGCIAALLVPVPIWFYLKGAKIREKSAYAPTAPNPSVTEEAEAK
jgi:hypothetical protein